MKKKKGWFIAAAVLLLIAPFVFGGNSGPVETVAVRQADLVRTVRISGKVTPREKVDLGFEIAGTVTAVNKNVGQPVSRGETLVRLDAGSSAADLAKARAELTSAQAEYNKLEGTQTFENSVTSDKRSVVQAIRDAYTAATDAVQNKADQLFVDPLTAHPVIAGNFEGYNTLRQAVDTGRVTVGYALDAWEKLLINLPAADYSPDQLTLSKKYLSEISTFISNLSQAVNMFQVTNYMSQATIDSYKADILAARQSLNTATQGFITAENGLSSTLSEVPVQLARVEAAKAAVLNLQFKVGKASLVSPISGIVSLQEAKVGQAISAGTIATSVISPDYIIETYVPEVSIAGIKTGNSATVTLDAYGAAETFAAKVDQIDPAETIRDGVSTYKVRLSFVARDERVRSGLTANVAIETLRKPNVTLIPERAVIREGDEAFVYILSGEKEVKTAVSVGEKDSQGNIELLSGLSTSDSVVVNPEK